MSNERIDSYRKSMEDLSFSDYEKERLVYRILDGGTVDGGRMRRKLDIRKIGIAVAACLMLFSVTAMAAGKVASIVSWNRVDTRTDNFEDLAKVEEKAGMDITAVESFSNGYAFDHIEVEEMRTQDEDGNDLNQYKGISIEYSKEGMPKLFVSIEPSEVYGEDEGVEERATAVKEVDGVTLRYNYDEYLGLPVGEKATDEEMQREETDDHFFISSGSDERETYYVSSVNFELDGITYILMSFDLDMTADEILGMAEEIIAAK
jgi:hypothetical protein